MDDFLNKKLNITVKNVQSANFELMNKPYTSYSNHHFNGQIDVHLQLGHQSHSSAFTAQDVNAAFNQACDNYAKKL